MYECLKCHQSLPGTATHQTTELMEHLVGHVPYHKKFIVFRLPYVFIGNAADLVCDASGIKHMAESNLTPIARLHEEN